MKIYALTADRIFEYLSQTEYEKKDGSTGRFATWRSTCIECGAPFEITTAVVVGTIAASKTFGRVRCDLHKRTSQGNEGESK